MVIPGFAYHRPATIAEACYLAGTLDGEARFLAGGTELIPELKRGRAKADHVISLRDVEGLREIKRVADTLHVGAGSSLEAVARSAAVRTAVPALSEAAACIGCMQIREQGTIGGNFCGAVPCADTPPVCIAAGAKVVIAGPRAQRTLPAEDLFVGPRKTALLSGEMLVEIELPSATRPGHGLSYQRFGLRKGMAVAVASVAAFVRLEEGAITSARVALGAVAPVPLLVPECTEALVGSPPTSASLQAAARAASACARPICDVRGSDEYRREVVLTLARRALAQALARAGWVQE